MKYFDPKSRISLFYDMQSRHLLENDYVKRSIVLKELAQSARAFQFKNNISNLKQRFR